MRLRYYNDSILRKKSEEVEEVTEEIKTLAKEMIVLMHKYRGIGLAAPQVGILKRLFVSCLDYEDEEGELHIGESKVWINPKASNFSEEKVERNEGCLSMPGLYAPVIRPLRIDIEALDIDGKPFSFKPLEGFVARMVLHEIDHLDGVLYVDRIKGKRRTMLDPMLRKIDLEYRT